MSPANHQLEVDALQTDRYLESLLLARERHANDSPADPSIDPAIRSAARRLARDLGRVHPSFRFEERLATRLAEMAARMRLPAAAGDGGQIIPVPLSPEITVLDPSLFGHPPLAPTSAGEGAAGDSSTAEPNAATALTAAELSAQDASAAPTSAPSAGTESSAQDRVPGTPPQSLPRPLIIGSAITSAALSLAGAAIVAWRLSHPGAHPIARAARAARSGRGPALPSRRGAGPDRARRAVTRFD